MKLDPVDRQLLDLVQADSSLSYAAMGRAVGLSISAVNERVRKLERAGAIRQYAALLDAELVGVPILAFVEVGIGQPGEAESFFNQMASRPEVQEVHRTTGPRQFLLKLRCASLARLESLIDQIIAAEPEVASTRVTVVLHSAKESPALPLGESVG